MPDSNTNRAEQRQNIAGLLTATGPWSTTAIAADITWDNQQQTLSGELDRGHRDASLAASTRPAS